LGANFNQEGFSMSMSGAITVDTTAGGVTIIATGMRTRLVTLANTGNVTAFLKLDASTTALTAANGHPLAPGEKLILGLNAGFDGTELPAIIKGITAGGSTTVVAQCAPFGTS
jgi:hypothetical protein